MNQRFLKPSYIAEELDLSPKTVHRMIVEGDLKAIKARSGKRKTEYRVYRESFELWLKRHEVTTPKPKARSGNRTSQDESGEQTPNTPAVHASGNGDIPEISQHVSESWKF